MSSQTPPQYKLPKTAAPSGDLPQRPDQRLNMTNGAVPSPASASRGPLSHNISQYKALPAPPPTTRLSKHTPSPVGAGGGQHQCVSPTCLYLPDSITSLWEPPSGISTYDSYRLPLYPSYLPNQEDNRSTKPLENEYRGSTPIIDSTSIWTEPNWVPSYVSADSGYQSDPQSPASMPDSRDAVDPWLPYIYNDFDDFDAFESSSPKLPGVAAITSPAPASCPISKISNPNEIMERSPSPAETIRAFPTLGLKSTNDDPSFVNQATLENGQSPGQDSHITATDIDSSPISSDLSSSGWTENGQDAETLRLISISSNILLSTYLKLAMNYASKDGKDGAMDDSPPCTATSKQTERTQNSSNGRKRKLNSFDSGSDDFDDNGNPKRQKNRSTQPAQAISDILPLACPFNKYDSILFGPDSPEEAYHACATCNFVNIAHLKQHLQRNHYMPKHYCFRCCRRFTSQATAASHMRQHPPCETLDPPLYRERIGPDMVEDLGLDRKNLPGTNRVEYWYRLYNAFFPGAADRRPVTPYYEGPAAQHLGRFLYFSQPAIRDILPEAQQRLGLEGTLPGHDLIRLVEEILQDAAQRYLQQLTGVGAFQIGQADSFTTIGSIVASQPESANSNSDANPDATQSPSTPPPSTQEGLLEPSQPTISSASTTSGSTIESPTVPRTPLSAVTADRTIGRLTTADGLLTQDPPVKPTDNEEESFPPVPTIVYSPGFNWAADFDRMEGFDWDTFLPDSLDEAKAATALEPEGDTVFD